MAKPAKTAGPVKSTAVVRCAPEVQHRVKVYAARERTTVAAVVNSALDEYLKKRGA